MDDNQVGNMEKTKQNSFLKWWTEQLAQQQSKDTHQILSDSFACYAITVSLLFFYLQLPTVSVMAWVVFAISLFFASFLLSTACVEKQHHVQFYLYTSWFDDKIFIPWAFIFTPIMIFLRLAYLYRSTISTSGHNIQIDTMFIILGLYFLAYIIIYFLKSIKTVMGYREKTRDETLREMAMSGLLFILIIMLVDFLTLTSVSNTEILRYLGVLVVTSIPLLIATYIAVRPLSPFSLTISSLSLIVIIVGTILLFIGKLWISFALLAAAFVILGFGTYFTATNKYICNSNLLRSSAHVNHSNNP